MGEEGEEGRIREGHEREVGRGGRKTTTSTSFPKPTSVVSSP
jgi:hypothetical protein